MHPVIGSPNLTLAPPDILERIRLESAAEPVLLYFATEWCGPCQRFRPILEEVLAPRHLRAYVVDGDVNEDAVDRFAIDGFPTLVLVRNGVALWRITGGEAKETLERELDLAVASLAGHIETPADRLGPDLTPGTYHFPLPAPGTGTIKMRLLTTGAVHDLAGQDVALTQDSLVYLELGVDPLTGAPAGPYTWLSELPDTLYYYVSITMLAADLDLLTQVTRLRTQRLELESPYPLPPAALDIITAARTASLMISAPGLDAAELATRMPGVAVNHVQLVSSRPRATKPAALTWTPPAQLRTSLTTVEEPLVALVQPRHRAETSTLAPLAEAASAAGVQFVSAFGDEELWRLAVLEPQSPPALLGFAEGRLRWRRDLPGNADWDEVSDLIQQAWSSPSPTPETPAPTLPVRAARSVRSTQPDCWVTVSLAGGVPSGRLQLPLGEVALPAGVRLARELQATPGARLTGLDAIAADQAYVHVIDGAQWSAADLRALAGLASLTLDIAGVPEGIVDVLAELTDLVNLRLRRAARTLQPELAARIGHRVIIDGRWPHA